METLLNTLKNNFRLKLCFLFVSHIPRKALVEKLNEIVIFNNFSYK